jgi:hypothetical protein
MEVNTPRLALGAVAAYHWSFASILRWHYGGQFPVPKPTPVGGPASAGPHVYISVLVAVSTEHRPESWHGAVVLLGSTGGGARCDQCQSRDRAGCIHLWVASLALSQLRRSNFEPVLPFAVKWRRP